MNILITGGTGFVGQALTQYFISEGHDIYILTRQSIDDHSQEQRHYVQWLTKGSHPLKSLPIIDAVINLAGTSINSGRWTSKKKENILQSRLKATWALVALMENMPIRPRVLINASAIGYYGTSQETVFDEGSGYENGDFLANVVYHWEEAAAVAERLGVRTVTARFGLVLGGRGGALSRMALPYRYLIGGTVASGKQWVSWVHIDDLVRLIHFIMKNDHINGPINITAPHPVQMKTFGQTIGHVMKRPHWFPVPSLMLRIALGEMSSLLVKGQKVLPSKALDAHFIFKYPKLEDALKNLL